VIRAKRGFVLLVAFAAVTAAATTAVTATATSTAALFAGTSFVDSQAAAFDLFQVEGLDRCLSLVALGHFDESEALAAAGVAVLNDLCALDAPMLGEERFQALTRNVVTQIPDIQSRTH